MAKLFWRDGVYIPLGEIKGGEMLLHRPGMTRGFAGATIDVCLYLYKDDLQTNINNGLDSGYIPETLFSIPLKWCGW